MTDTETNRSSWGAGRHVCVVGAGPSGLVTAKTLRECGFAVTVFESEERIGGTFRYRAYENAELVSSKQLTAFSDFRLPDDQDDHLTLAEYVAYLERYAARFGLDSAIVQCGVRVDDIVWEAARDVHRVTYTRLSSNTRESAEFFAVAVCSGLHVTPVVPSIAGDNQFRGRKLHSSAYRKREEFTGKNVVILGSGETGLDLAYEAVQTAEKVTVCTQNGFLSIPKTLPEMRLFSFLRFRGTTPIDTLISNLFENSYVHSWVRRLRLRWHISDFFLRNGLRLFSGSPCGMGQLVGHVSQCGRAYNILNKSSRAIPYINRPFESFHFAQLFFRFVYPSVDRTIHVKTSFPQSITENGVLVENETIECDTLVYATGYEHSFPFLANHSFASRNQTRTVPSRGDVREMLLTPSDDDTSTNTLALIGFVRPGVGAIPPLSELQAMWWATALAHRPMQCPLEPETYRLLKSPCARIQHGVDYSGYAYQLAVDMGAAPSLLTLLRRFGVRVAVAFSMEAAFTPLFRLTGPFAHKDAPTIATTELWATVTRRGIMGNLLMAIIPMAFYGVLNVACWFLSGFNLFA